MENEKKRISSCHYEKNAYLCSIKNKLSTPSNKR